MAENPDVDYWKAFIKERGMMWVNVCDDQPGRDSKAWKDYTLPGIPTVLLIDCETGAIIARKDDMDKILEKLFQ